MASSNDKSKPTVRAVVAYAAQLRRKADAARVADPHASLYRPSEAGARKLSQRHGPERALELLATAARRAELRAEEAEGRAKDGRARLHAVQVVALDEERRAREGLSWGMRLDVALAALEMSPGVGSSRLDADRVSGGGHGDGGASSGRRDRDVAVAGEEARRAVVALERLVARDRRRLVDREAA